MRTWILAHTDIFPADHTHRETVVSVSEIDHYKNSGKLTVVELTLAPLHVFSGVFELKNRL